MNICINGCNIICDIKRDRRRRTVLLKVSGPDKISVTAPLYVKDADLENILIAKKRWLSNRIKDQQRLATNPANQAVAAGLPLLFRGKTYQLALKESPRSSSSVSISSDHIIVSIPPAYSTSHEYLSSVLQKWYVSQATALLHERTKYWAAKIGVTPSRLTMRDQKTRWGSCSSKGNVNYSWRLVMAPDAVVDYLVIHELCHMHIPNHSADFWQLVSRYSPDYDKHRQWLHENGKVLMRLFAN